MVRKRVYRSKRNALGKRTRYQVWMEIGERRKRARPARRTRPGPLDQAWTAITSWLRSTGGTAKRRSTSRRRGWSTTDVHPQLYRRAAPRSSPRPADEVARMRQRRRNRGRR